MNIIRVMLCFITLTSFTTVYAEDKPLRVGITHFLPPYVMQGPNNQSYGFDVEMMVSVCKIIKRHCIFHAMQFDQLIPAVADNKIDVAVSFLTITPERYQKVNFSIPYLLSQAQVLSKQPVEEKVTPFRNEYLQGKKIGVVSGTVFYEQLKSLHLNDPKIKLYPSNASLISALNSDEVEFVLVNKQAAHYWEANSSGIMHSIGTPFVNGYSVGIAVNKDDPVLLSQINKALLEYSNSNEFTHNYEKFLNHF